MQHVNSWKHREFARNNSNYKIIDELINNELRIEDLIVNLKNDAKETIMDDIESVMMYVYTASNVYVLIVVKNCPPLSSDPNELMFCSNCL